MTALVGGVIAWVVAMSGFFAVEVAARMRRRAGRRRAEAARSMPGDRLGHVPVVRIAEGIVHVAYESGQDRP